MDSKALCTATHRAHFWYTLCVLQINHSNKTKKSLYPSESKFSFWCFDARLQEWNLELYNATPPLQSMWYKSTVASSLDTPHFRLTHPCDVSINESPDTRGGTIDSANTRLLHCLMLVFLFFFAWISCLGKNLFLSKVPCCCSNNT